MHIVFFDLDGTITRRDTLAPFVLRWLIRRPWRLVRLLGVVPALCRFTLLGGDRGALKAALIQHTLGGLPRVQVDAWCARFVPALLRDGLFVDALAVINAHRDAGDHLVLMSASVDLYVPAIGAALGFTETICTRVRWRGALLDGALDGPNCRGEEKLRHLQAARAAYAGCSITAYGNSAPDLPHLRAADRGVLVNGSAALRAAAQRNGVECVDWR